ncbi:hypothetical protein DFJ74DRAFT_728355, partial [Hyaloraphidium curvatum]
ESDRQRSYHFPPNFTGPVRSEALFRPEGWSGTTGSGQADARLDPSRAPGLPAIRGGISLDRICLRRTTMRGRGLLQVVALFGAAVLVASHAGGLRSQLEPGMTAHADFSPASLRPRDAVPPCASWQRDDPNTVCVVARGFHGYAPYFSTYASSLAHGSVRVKVLAADTGSPNGPRWDAAAHARHVNAILGCPDFAHALDVPYADVERHLLSVVRPEQQATVAAYCNTTLGLGNTNSGHNRDTCIYKFMGADYSAVDAIFDTLLGSNNTGGVHTDCKYLVISSADNLFRMGFADLLKPWLHGGEEGPADLIGFDFVSKFAEGENLIPKGGADDTGAGPSHYIPVEFARTKIDMAAAMIRTDWLRKQRLADGSPLRLIRNAAFGDLVTKAHFAEHMLIQSDGIFYEELARRLPSGKVDGRRRKVLVHRILLVHQ